MRMPTSKSPMPNWLDKLRKVKGFASDGGGHGIDHFLVQQPQQQQQEERNDEDHLHPVRRRASQPGNLSNRMADMLAELFSDGRGGAEISNFKARRKQPSPKMCIVPATVEDKGSNENSRVFVDDGVFGPMDVNRNPESQRKVRRGLGEEEKGKGKKLEDCDLVGFSRTEVSIIDSSCPLWKFDKYLFRKKNVWKARDCRKGRPPCNKNVAIARKKKREALDDDDDDDDGVVVSKKSKTFGLRK